MEPSLQTGKKLFLCLLILIGLCMLTIGSVSAKYTVSARSEDSARVARFQVFTSDLQLVLDGKNESTVSFSVSNGLSEVSIVYDVIISLPVGLTALGVEMKLFCNEEARETFKSETIGEEAIYTFSGAGSFEAGKSTTDSLRLRLSISDPKKAETFQLSIDVAARQTL